MSDGSSRCFIYLRFSSNPWFPLPCLDLSRICRCKRVQACGPCLFSWNFLKVCLRLKTFIVPIGQQGHLPTAPINGACQAYCGSCEWQPYLRALFNCHSSDGKHEDEDRSTCRWDWYSCMWKRWDKCPHESCQVSFFKRWFLEEPYPHASVVKDQTCNMEVHAFFVARTIGRIWFHHICSVDGSKVGSTKYPQDANPAPKPNLDRFGSLPTPAGQGFHVQRWSGEKTAFKNFLLKYHGDTWHVWELPILGPMTSP